MKKIMKTMRMLSGLLFMLCSVAALTPVEAVSAAGRAGATMQRSANFDITGTVIGVGGRFGGRSAPFRLIINQFTTPAEVQRLNAALQGGQDELLNVLSKMDAGRIQVGNNVGITANAIIATQQPEGVTKLTVLYQRNVNFYELRYGSRSENYRFGFAELYLNARGKGEGTFIPAAQVRLRDGNVWEVEDFGVYPARLLGLQERGRRIAR